MSIRENKSRRKSSNSLLKTAGLVVVFSGFLAACGTSFKSDVATFHKISAESKGTVTLTTSDENKAASLEYQQYAGVIASELQRLGYQVKESGQTDYVVDFDLSISDGRERIETRFAGTAIAPIGFGCFRCRGAFFGPYGFGAFGGGFGGGFNSDIVSRTVYHTELSVVMSDTDGDHIFEGRAETDIRGNRLPESVPLLARALFKDFPGKSGVTREVVIPPKERKTLESD